MNLQQYKSSGESYKTFFAVRWEIFCGNNARKVVLNRPPTVEKSPNVGTAKKKTFTGVIYRRSKFSCNSCPSDDYYYASKLQP
jgi:hypothetical protein